MTTIAWDGTFMAADTLGVDAYGLTNRVNKLYQGKNFIAGVAGSHSQAVKWWQKAQDIEDIIAFGYPDFDKDNDDPSVMIATCSGVYTHTGGILMKQYRRFHAIGSGRDFALAAMLMGATAEEAVRVAAEFDVNTNNDIMTWKL